MKKITIVILLLYILLPGCRPAKTDKLNELVAAYTKGHRFNGAALVAENGTILLDKGYGWQDQMAKTPNTAQSIFQLGSITKQFTSAVVLKLQEEKKLNVKDKLSKYFPAYPKGDSITIEQLLTHTSGVYNYTNDSIFMVNEMTKPATREKMMSRFQEKPLDFSPGTGWNYSNSGYSLLGYIIEIVTGKPYDQVVRDDIFTPLQMTNTGFDFIHLKSPEKAIGYENMYASTPIASPIVDSSFSFSAGAIYSTTGDLYKWSNALETYTILSRDQEEMAFTVVKNNYGYGWGIDSIAGKRRVSHQGGIPGFRTIIARVPADDICIILLSNGSDESLQEISNGIFAILYDKPYKLP
jgi:CubicO group peptidase (beta-lactamase class C family)